MKQQSGYILVALIIVMVMGLIISTALVSLMINSAMNVQSYNKNSVAYNTAESGIENAILNLLRDHDYDGETLTIDNALVVVTVAGEDTKTIDSVSTYLGDRQAIQAVVHFESGLWEVVSYQQK